MKDRKYLEAAKIVADPKHTFNVYSCLAILYYKDERKPNCWVMTRKRAEIIKANNYKDIFYDMNHIDDDDSWWNADKSKKNQLARSIALLLAYEMGL